MGTAAERLVYLAETKERANGAAAGKAVGVRREGTKETKEER